MAGSVMCSWAGVLLLLCASSGGAVHAQQAVRDTPLQPFLARHCVSCHGAQQQMGIESDRFGSSTGVVSEV